MKNIQISIVKAVQYEMKDSTAYYILCTESLQAGMIGERILILPFFDTTNPNHPRAFRPEQAQRILRFFQSIPDGADLLVCCDGGVSRSAAIAAALLWLQGSDESVVWNDPYYCPNPLVYTICCQTFLPERVERLLRISCAARQRAMTHESDGACL